VRCRPAEPIDLQAGQTVILTCDSSKQASSSVLPISYPSLTGTGLQPGRSVFVGQYLFTGEWQRQQRGQVARLALCINQPLSEHVQQLEHPCSTTMLAALSRPALSVLTAY
jgi:hypothetical protein